VPNTLSILSGHFY